MTVSQQTQQRGVIGGGRRKIKKMNKTNIIFYRFNQTNSQLILIQH